MDSPKDGNGGCQREPLEHPARPPHPALVQQIQWASGNCPSRSAHQRSHREKFTQGCLEIRSQDEVVDGAVSKHVQTAATVPFDSRRSAGWEKRNKPSSLSGQHRFPCSTNRLTHFFDAL